MGDRSRLPRGAKRIVYEVRDDELVVVLVKAGHRGEGYKGLSSPNVVADRRARRSEAE
jgi:hypothetical protein